MDQTNAYDIEKYRESLVFRVYIVDFCLKHYKRMLQWRGGERVMEIGCGVGDVTRRCFLPPCHFKRFVCADISIDMLEAARSELQGIEHVDFLLMDIRECPEDTLMAAFDRIFSAFCFMYISDQKEALKNVFDLLAPRGDCWIIQLSVAPLIEPFFQLAETPKWKYKLKDIREIYRFPFREDPDPVVTTENYMKSIGFTDVSVTLAKTYKQLESQKDYITFIESLPFPPRNFPEVDKEDLRKDLIEIAKTLNLFKGDTQDMKEPHQFLMIYGRKS